MLAKGVAPRPVDELRSLLSSNVRTSSRFQVLLSWPEPKGPYYDLNKKGIAPYVEDYPIE